MAKSVLELAVGTGQWDAGLKKAKSALDNFTQSQGGLQQALGKDSDKMQQFVRMMGQMDSTSKTAKGQMNDYKSTIEQLTMQYNRMTDAQKKSIGQDYLQSIDQLRQKYKAVNEEIQEMNRSLNQTKAPDLDNNSGGLFGGGKLDGMLQVFGGNMMTKVAAFGMNAVGNFASEIGDAVKQGIELAKQGEGIRMAFERLGRGDILDGLREATHGTVTDLELMKAAVKFNDFRLPVEELGTMLAFAQQKAKDTGQSVDYMVDSIVTGLGRKSLMILDNLGLSATEIRERMKETGDMTKAVGEIIREQMAKAGDYVETAADRAAQANVSLQNKMEELGRKFAPVEEASNQLWTSMKIGILDLIGGPLARLLNQLTEAGRLKNALNDINGNDGSGQTKAQRDLAILRRYSQSHTTEDAQRMANRHENKLLGYENAAWQRYNSHMKTYNDIYSGDTSSGSSMRAEWAAAQKAKNEALAWNSVLNEFKKGAKAILNPVASTPPPSPPPSQPPSSSTTNPPKTITEDKDDFEEIIGLIPNAEEAVRSLQQQIRESWDEGEIEKLSEDLRVAQAEVERLKNLSKGVDLDKLFPTQEKAGKTSLSRGEQMVQNIRAEIGFSKQKTDINTLRNLLEYTTKNAIEGINIPTDMLLEKIIGDGFDIPDEYWIKLEKEINTKTKEMGLDPISLDVTTGEVSGGGGIQNLVSGVNSGVDTLTQIIDIMKGIQSVLDDVSSNVSRITGGLNQMGIKTPEWINKATNFIGGMGNVLGGIAGFAGMFLGGGSISKLAKMFNDGGIVRAAGGYVVPGNYGYDAVPALLTSGELVLNSAQQNYLATELSNRGNDGGNIGTASIQGEQIFITLNNYLRRRGYGELLTTR